MALAEENALQFGPKRFPRDVREELKKIVDCSSWRALTKEFSVDFFTGIETEALDFIPNLVDSNYEAFREDVKMRIEILKRMKSGDSQSFKGKSKVGFHSYFYRFWLFCQRCSNGLYNIVFAQIARKEEFDFLLCLPKVIKGSTYAMTSAPPVISALLARLSQRAYRHVLCGRFGGDENEEPSLPAPTRPLANEPQANPYTDLSQELGDHLTDYEMVEDLIERGMLAENEDGTLYIRL